MCVIADTQHVEKLFSGTTYCIDFYQRQYKWTKYHVNILLDDVFYTFNMEYEKRKDDTRPPKEVINDYSWYYLNTYVTNDVGGTCYVVDGQQRLTTLTLILIKLKHLSKSLDPELSDWISDKIFGASGYEKIFRMNHDKHNGTLEELLDGGKPLDQIKKDSGLTAQNMVDNYRTISSKLEHELNNKHRFTRFVFYFMRRLMLINLQVKLRDVPMVFEVINDRGEGLKSYEILKGKLLGQIDKKVLDSLKLNDLWDDQVSNINHFNVDEIDQFFIYFLRAKYADTSTDGKRYDSDYHKVIFSENKLNLNHCPQEVQRFLQEDFKYYTNLYKKVLEYSKNSSLPNEFCHVYFNSLNEMNTQFLLILSSCKLYDPQENDKIRTIAYEVDRLFCLIQLQRSWDSNDFTQAIYKISADIRDKDTSGIRVSFDKALFELLSKRGINATAPLSYGFFKETGIDLALRFKRYFFARIDYFIAHNTNSPMKHSFHNLVSKTGNVNGFHIEHILANNSENLLLFDNDEDKFTNERNRLGGLLLMKGRDNISSGKEPYNEKLKSYAGTLHWNETLCEDIKYKSNLDFRDMMDKYKLKFKPLDTFGPVELEERHKLLFDIAKLIWE
jgi:uncharacterized protein with ParB-like and HNH nuclease domain